MWTSKSGCINPRYPIDEHRTSQIHCKNKCITKILLGNSWETNIDGRYFNQIEEKVKSKIDSSRKRFIFWLTEGFFGDKMIDK